METAKCCDFINVIGRGYYKIKNCFYKGLQKYGLYFDDDIFSETLIMCNNKLNGTQISDEDAIKYFWVSFKNNTIKEQEKISKYIEIEKEHEMIPDNVYDNRMDIMYDIIMDAISNKYGDEICNLWKEHIINGKTYEELQKTTKITNLHYQFRKIRDFIREELSLLNKEFSDIKKEII